jgi:hypothetical protein
MFDLIYIYIGGSILNFIFILHIRYSVEILYVHTILGISNVILWLQSITLSILQQKSKSIHGSVTDQRYFYMKCLQCKRMVILDIIGKM